jgi:hypothetical protein
METSRHDALRSEFLPAPRADDQIRFPRHHRLSRHNTVSGRALLPTIEEDVDAAGDLDELRDPPNSGDQRLVPFFEEYLWPLRQSLRAASGFGQTGFECSDELPSPFARVDYRAQRANHVEDPGDASLIEGMDVDPAANEIRGDVGLEIREGQDQIGLQGGDLVDIRRREGTYAWLLAASLRWAHDVAGDADDPILLAE